MSTPFAKAKSSSVVGRERREHGGDNEVERTANGRPRIINTCTRCEGTGKVPSEKVEGRLNKCARCKGEGKRKESYTRVTTFVSALEDQENLITYQGRMVLVGAAMDTGLLTDVLSMDPEEKEDRDVLNRRSEAAKTLAGGDKKSEHGTLLHTLSEDCDNGLPLGDDVDMQDWLDIRAYADATQPLLKIVHMEQLVVNDYFRCAGTPDRVSSIRPGVTLRDPNGRVIPEDELLITDLKTGRIDYGGLKIAQQFSMYSHSDLYDKATGDRIPMPNVNDEWGIMMHLPAGSGTCTLYWVDLLLGWEAIHASWWVRNLRARGRKAFYQFNAEGTSPFAKAA